MVNNSTLGVKAIMSYLKIVGKIYRGGGWLGCCAKIDHRIGGYSGCVVVRLQPLRRGCSVAGYTPFEAQGSTSLPYSHTAPPKACMRVIARHSYY